MIDLDQFLRLALTYRDALEVPTTTVSWRVFGDSKKLDALADGADIQSRRLVAAWHWFAEHWPTDANWPVDVPRPLPSPHANNNASSEPAA